jgi:hypothetical protein
MAAPIGRVRRVRAVCTNLWSLTNEWVVESATSILAREIAQELARALKRQRESDGRDPRRLREIEPALLNIDQAAKYLGRTVKGIRRTDRVWRKSQAPACMPSAVFCAARGFIYNGAPGWCASTDKEFAPKAAEIVGLYLNPPLNAVVLSVDEKRASRRSNGPPVIVETDSGKVVRALKSTYKRHGTR